MTTTGETVNELTGDVLCPHGFILRWGGEWGINGPECTCGDPDSECPWREPACDQGCPDWRDKQ